MPDPSDPAAKPAVVYMSYDGMLEPVAESQAVSYLEKLSDAYCIHLISFEKPHDFADVAKRSAMEKRLRRAGIAWYPRTYHKRPPIVSTLWDMVAAIVLAVRLARRHRARLLHARSVLCAAMLYPARWAGGARLLVDIRGLWVDERIDAGIIAPDGLVARVLRMLERAMLRRGDHVVTVTRASVPHLRDDPRFGHPKTPISVIPCCADLDLFTPPSAPGDGESGGPLTIGYIGQIGTWYLFDEMLAFFAAVRRLRPDARLLIVNKSQHDEVRAAMMRAGIDPSAVEILQSTRPDMPAQIRRMNAAMALIRPYFSKIGAAPVKFAEYLGCGVPVVGNEGCGDMSRIIRDRRVGVAMADTDHAAIDRAACDLLVMLRDPDLAARCVAAAHEYFSLDDGAGRFRAIYDTLATADA